MPVRVKPCKEGIMISSSATQSRRHHQHLLSTSFYVLALYSCAECLQQSQLRLLPSVSRYTVCHALMAYA